MSAIENLNIAVAAVQAAAAAEITKNQALRAEVAAAGAVNDPAIQAAADALTKVAADLNAAAQ